MTLSTIVLATDLSDAADAAMRQAVEIAVATEGKLEIFHAVTLDGHEPENIEDALDDYLAKLEQEVFTDLSERMETMMARGLSVKISTRRSLAPAQAILDFASEVKADLIVVGTHGRSGIKKFFLGSVAESVVRHAQCPVLTVGTDARIAEGKDGLTSILVPVDFTDHSAPAVAAAEALLAPGGRLVLQHVVANPVHPSFYAGGLTRMFQIDPDLPGRITEKLRELYGGPADYVVEEGSVVTEILQAAEEKKVQMIVMGTKGLTGLDHVLVGSVTERVIGKADVPVLAIK